MDRCACPGPGVEPTDIPRIPPPWTGKHFLRPHRDSPARDDIASRGRFAHAPPRQDPPSLAHTEATAAADTAGAPQVAGRPTGRTAAWRDTGPVAAGPRIRIAKQIPWKVPGKTNAAAPPGKGGTAASREPTAP